jgi:hypothetical protein
MAGDCFVLAWKCPIINVDCNFETVDVSSESDRITRGQRRAHSIGIEGGITIAAAKRSSEDAATLVQYIIAVVKFSRLHALHKKSKDKQQDLEKELADHERRLQEEREQV